MSSATFRRLCAVRQIKVERASREVARRQEALAQREEALLAARAAAALRLAERGQLVDGWRAERLALSAFDTEAYDGHQAELTRCERRIAQAQAVVQVHLAERDEAARALRAAAQALLACRIDLNKAERATEQHRVSERVRDEALEEDEQDELSVVARGRAQAMEAMA